MNCKNCQVKVVERARKVLWSAPICGDLMDGSLNESLNNSQMEEIIEIIHYYCPNCGCVYDTQFVEEFEKKQEKYNEGKKMIEHLKEMVKKYKYKY